ncbi:MAG: glycosyltransferase family 2 protein [Candidatus Aenigmatarchaeota archaeon]
MIKVSVIICTRNRLDELKKSLQRVLNQKFKNYEVIVVDNASTDVSIKDYVQKMSKISKKLKYISAPKKPNLPYARNVGLKYAKGEIIAFIDDDSFVSKNWIKEVVNCFKDESVGAAGGRVVIPRNSNLFENEYLKSKGLKRFFYEMFALFIDYYGKPGSIKNSGQVVAFFDYKKFIYIDHVWGCNMFFRKDALERAGGFDEAYENYPLREDTDMCVRIKKLGYKILFNPKAKVFHKLSRKEVFPRMNFYYRNKHHIYFVFKNKLIKGFSGWIKFILQQISEVLFYFLYSMIKNKPSILIDSFKGKIDGFRTIKYL